MLMVVGHGWFPRGGGGEVAGDLLAAVGHRVREVRVVGGGAGLGPGRALMFVKKVWWG